MSVMAAAELNPAGAKPWLASIPEPGPGVYVVSLVEDPEAAGSTIATCPIDPSRLEELLTIRPELNVDGQRPETGGACGPALSLLAAR